MTKQSPAIEVLLQESRLFPPPEEFAQQAIANDAAIYERAAQDPEGFWAEQAKELHWFRPWDKVLQWDPPFAQWFVGGKLNVSYNCLDRHLSTPRRNKAALIWEGEPGDWRVYTYWDLHREVCRFANALKSPGREEGRPGHHLPAHDP